MFPSAPISTERLSAYYKAHAPYISAPWRRQAPCRPAEYRGRLFPRPGKNLPQARLSSSSCSSQRQSAGYAGSRVCLTSDSGRFPAETLKGDVRKDTPPNATRAEPDGPALANTELNGRNSLYRLSPKSRRYLAASFSGQSLLARSLPMKKRRTGGSSTNSRPPIKSRLS